MDEESAIWIVVLVFIALNVLREVVIYNRSMDDITGKNKHKRMDNYD